MAKETPVTAADATPSPEEVAAETFAAFGAGFSMAEDFRSTTERINEAMGNTPQRANTPPSAVEAWELRLGASRFFVPPLNINVSQQFKTGNLTGAAIRQQSAPKFNTGHTETVVTMTLYFPNYKEVFGYEDSIFRIDFDSDPDAKVDEFLSSLRGLIAQFRYAPFLPVKNAYLNGTFGITGLTMKDMTLATVPGYPFCMAVTLTMYKFNHKVFLPMIEHFDQAIHWGRYRQYMGRAAARLAQASKPIADFGDNLISNSETDTGFVLPSLRTAEEILNGVQANLEGVEGKQQYRRHLPAGTSLISENDRSADAFDFYMPFHTPAAIELPDLKDLKPEPPTTSSGRKRLWEKLLEIAGVPVNDHPEARFEAMRTRAEEHGEQFSQNAGSNAQYKLLVAYIKRMNLTAELMGPGEMDRFYEQRLAETGFTADSPAGRELKIQVQQLWFYTMYRLFMEDSTLAKELAWNNEKRKQLTINEWELPMYKLGLDKDAVKVEGISVTMGNVIARLQLQLQDEPTHQHIGGADTRIDISLTVFGETELVKLRAMFEQISGLARLEHGHGVLGFLAVKNIITELCGLRYVIPLNFEVDTVPGYPHVYDVRITLTDFDIFQQQRETLTSEQQAELIEAFGKRNPFLRLKQLWSMFNGYPDFPLSVRDEEGKTVGCLDPDFYFRHFKAIDDDIVGNEVNRHLGPDRQGRDNKVGKDIIRALERADEAERRAQVAKGEPGYRFDEGEGVHTCVGVDENGTPQYVSFNDGRLSLYSGDQANMVDARFNEAHPGNMIPGSFVEGCAPPSGYIEPYFGGGGDPYIQYSTMMKDTQYRDKGGRMVRAFPTYMLWLIDEGGTFAGMKLFDNFYGLQSVIDFSISQSEDILGDTLMLRVSNLYSKLSTKFHDYLEDDQNPSAQIINQNITRLQRLASGVGDYVVNLDTIKLAPGVRVHLRMGYGANPNRLDTVFNGVVTEVQSGEIMTIVAQSDAIELSAIVNTSNEKGHSGKIDGSMTGLYMSEPRDLMISLLTQAGSTVKEMAAHATRGAIFSENRYGIKHFGSMLYTPLGGEEVDKNGRQTNKIEGLVAKYAEDQSASGQIVGLMNQGVADVGTMLFSNMATKRDYEVFKRNIYPGNGTGIAQFMGGDVGDLGLSLAIDGVPSLQDGAGFSGDVDFTGLDAKGAIESAIVAQTGSVVQRDGVTGSTPIFGVDVDADLIRPSAIINATLSGLANWTATQTSGARNLGGGSVNLGNAALNMGVDVLEMAGALPGSAHGLLGAMGIINQTDDDGPFDEVAFRAQTYMKTVWDLFQVCAALLPDYIVAVRPFEDRSTVFYGKPHWLYTSGVIPLTTGVKPEDGPSIVAPDEMLEKLYADLEAEMAKTDSTESFESFFAGAQEWRPAAEDPAASTGGIPHTGTGSGASLAAEAAHKAGFRGEDLVMMVAIAGAETGGSYNVAARNSNTDGTQDNGMWQINTIHTWVDFNKIDDPFYNAEVAYTLVMRKKNSGNQRYFGDWAVHEHWGGKNRAYVNKYKDHLATARAAVAGLTAVTSKAAAIDQGKIATQASPTTTTAPTSFSNPTTTSDAKNAGEDIYRQTYEKSGRTADDAEGIWSEFRAKFPGLQETEGAFARAPQFRSVSQADYRIIKDQVFDQVVASFVEFIDSNPYYRGWLVRVTDKNLTRSVTSGLLTGGIFGAIRSAVGLGEEAITGSSNEWDFTQAINLFGVYISQGDAAAAEFMKTNANPGSNHANLVGRAIAELGEGIRSVWDSVSGAFAAIKNVGMGLINFMRTSLRQLTNGLSMASNMQRQTNALNRIFNDSIYYSAGIADGQVVNPLLYYADNPFTREYAEPVAEIRQPFQRLHMVSSFQHIINNGIIETSEQIPTIVTANSNGKHPVTVHFDKGIPSERQVETTVDTGLFWDMPDGIFSKLFNPIETARGWMKATGVGRGDATNMETSAKRVALWHLKEGLKDIYQGELTILGDASIRPHDLVYMGDVYERMYGFFEVEQVVHHFTPETGFVTSVTPNACVTINDPAAFMFRTYWKSRGDVNAVRDYLRQTLKVHADTESGSNYGSGGDLTVQEIADKVATQVENSIQYSGGASALVKSIAGAGAVGGLIGGPIGAGVGSVLGWGAWKWVRSNLLDQHGCYIQYLTHNGQPMDAGLNYNQGTAVGHQNTVGLVLRGTKLGEMSTLRPDGSTRVRTTDVIKGLQWTEEDGPNQMAAEVDMFVDATIAQVRRLAGRDPITASYGVETYWCRVKNVRDGDTIDVDVLGHVQFGQYEEKSVYIGKGVRFAGAGTAEDGFKDDPIRAALNPNDPGVRATNYTREMLMPNGEGLLVAIRVYTAERRDRYDRALGYVFHRAPEGMLGSERKDFLLNAAGGVPFVAWDSFMEDGRPYTINWELVVQGFADVYTADLKNNIPNRGASGGSGSGFGGNS